MQNEQEEENGSKSGTQWSRRNRDLRRLADCGFEAVVSQDKPNQLAVMFKGPEASPYKEGRWVVQVHLPDQYPIKPPSLGFVNHIFHPNIDPRYSLLD